MSAISGKKRKISANSNIVKILQDILPAKFLAMTCGVNMDMRVSRSV